MKSYPKLEALNRFHLPVIIGMKISLCGANMGMAHQSLDGSKIIPIIQKGRGKGMTDNMGMNPLLNQSLFCHPTTLIYASKGLILLRHGCSHSLGGWFPVFRCNWLQHLPPYPLIPYISFPPACAIRIDTTWQSCHRMEA
jgi:hypothetical protein